MKVLTGCVIAWIIFLGVLLAVDSWAGQTTIRPNDAFGQPDYFRTGYVVEKKYYSGDVVIRPETQPGSRVGDRNRRGIVIEDNGDGSYTGRRETLPGSRIPDIWDNGFTINTE